MWNSERTGINYCVFPLKSRLIGNAIIVGYKVMFYVSARVVSLFIENRK